jgi:prevent-host-death family protein
MKASLLMEKTIGAFEIRRQFGKILQEVAVKGDRVVVERHGEPIAAVIPMEVYRQWKRSRQAFFDQMRAVSERANLTEGEADELVTEAIAAARTTPTT